MSEILSKHILVVFQNVYTKYYQILYTTLTTVTRTKIKNFALLLDCNIMER